LRFVGIYQQTWLILLTEPAVLVAEKGKQKAGDNVLGARLVFVLYEVTGKLGSENIRKGTPTGNITGLLLLRITKCCVERFLNEAWKNMEENFKFLKSLNWLVLR
jgi:hypothetical protein